LLFARSSLISNRFSGAFGKGSPSGSRADRLNPRRCLDNIHQISSPWITILPFQNPRLQLCMRGICPKASTFWCPIQGINNAAHTLIHFGQSAQNPASKSPSLPETAHRMHFKSHICIASRIDNSELQPHGMVRCQIHEAARQLTIIKLQLMNDRYYLSAPSTY
jgi:hypothetical protein